MYSQIEANRPELIRLCQRLGVRRLELFGSAASGGFDPKSSDLDFLVEFQDLAPAAYANAYFDLLEGLNDLFHRPVDLVTLPSVKNPYFLHGIEHSRTMLYAA